MTNYSCPNCNKNLIGSFGDNVYCDLCNKTYETDWDYSTEENIVSLITDVEHEGKINVE